MTLAEITSRNAVLETIAEFDVLGRDAFLAKHGFGRARDYVLIHEGREYDSKAIVGVAHGKQHGEILTSDSFSGGAATVEAKLRELGFEVRSGKKPNWTRDELILALDLYLREGLVDRTHPLVIELSCVLSGLPVHGEWRYTDGFRNANGVAMKLANFAALDPAYTGKGLSAGGRADRDVWDEFHSDPALVRRVAEEIMSAASSMMVDEEHGEEEEAAEGRLLFRRHRARERDRRLVAKKKAHFRSLNNGVLCCEVCGFDFEAVYGARGDDYADCHHLLPLSVSGETKTTFADLAIVCANCHRMIHVRRPMLTIVELRDIVMDRRRANETA